jgi:hypothetical protein
MTITWHIDDLKILHVDPFKITKFCQYLTSILGKGLMVHRGKVHDYLGMDLHFGFDGVFQVSMITYTNKVILDFPEEINTTCTSPAGDHLFTVRNASDAKLLPEEQAQAFHPTVAQLLFLCKCTCRDVQTTFSFLTTRVKHLDKDDWGKLKCVLRQGHATHET